MSETAAFSDQFETSLLSVCHEQTPSLFTFKTCPSVPSPFTVVDILFTFNNE